MAAKSKKDEESFLGSVLRGLGDMSLNAATLGMAPLLRNAPKIKHTPRASSEALANTPKLQRDPNRDIMTTTTDGDAQGNVYFLPKEVDRLPDLVKGTTGPVTRAQVKEYMDNKELDAMPSRLAEIKAERAAKRKAAETPLATGTTASSSPTQGLFGNVNVRDIATAATAKPPSMGMGSIVDSISPTDIVKSDGMSPAASPAASSAPSRDFNALFKTATGTAFDPKSKLDRTRMAEIQSMMNSRADLADKSDNKVALAWYASKRK